VSGRLIEDPSELPALGTADRLLAAGGDGTMSRLASRCADQGCILGVLPAGTGNDFARGLGIPLDPQEACRNIATGVVREIDLGMVGDRVFLNVAHIGLGSEISREISASDKRWWGRFSYLSRVLRRLKNQRGFKATIQCGDFVKRERWLEIAIANGRSFGGGHPVFDATPFDGKLDLIAVRPRSVTQLILAWFKVHIFDAAPSEADMLQLRGTCCEISHCRRQPISADGETAGFAPTTFTVLPRALRVIVPASEQPGALASGADSPDIQ
jgi:YegS/Rv2252/BmrU family lipid kinase